MEQDKNDPHSAQVTSAPTQPLAQTSQSPSSPPLFSEESHTTKPARPKIFIISLILVLVFILIICLLVALGTTTNDYSTARAYSDTASLFVYAIGATTGFAWAYRILHPRKPKTKSAGRYVLAAFGFLFGLVPGLILGAILAYPLSQHACRLSGAKYC